MGFKALVVKRVGANRITRLNRSEQRPRGKMARNIQLGTLGPVPRLTGLGDIRFSSKHGTYFASTRTPISLCFAHALSHSATYKNIAVCAWLHFLRHTLYIHNSTHKHGGCGAIWPLVPSIAAGHFILNSRSSACPALLFGQRDTRRCWPACTIEYNATLQPQPLW